MQVFKPLDPGASVRVGWGVRVLLLTAEPAGPVAARLAGLGAQVTTAAEFLVATAAVLDDPLRYSLVVIDCDAFGGLQVGHAAAAHLCVPVILIGSACAVQQFPQEAAAPTVLRAPLSAVSLRVGFEHALRHHLLWQAA